MCEEHYRHTQGFFLAKVCVRDQLAYNGTLFICGRHAYHVLSVNWTGSCCWFYVMTALRRTPGPKHLGEKHDLFSNVEAVTSPTQCCLQL